MENNRSELNPLLPKINNKMHLKNAILFLTIKIVEQKNADSFFIFEIMTV